MGNFKLGQQNNNSLTLRELTQLALLVAACVVGRMLFQFIPNVQPMTAIFLIITIQRGLRQGLIVSILSVLVSNLYLGMGSWTLSQLVSYALVIGLAGLLSKWPLFKNRLSLQLMFSFVAGFLYGLIISLIDYHLYGMTAFLPYYLQGLSFDFLHALGNSGFYLILSPLISRLLDRYGESQIKK